MIVLVFFFIVYLMLGVVCLNIGILIISQAAVWVFFFSLQDC